MEQIRIWKETDINDVRDHILIVDDKFGHCPSCKEFGIPLTGIKKCPGCDSEIRYITSKDATSGRNEIVTRMKKKLPEMIFVDYDDFIRVTSQKDARNLFSV